MTTPDLLDDILDALKPHGLTHDGPAGCRRWKANPPWREKADGLHLSIEAAPEYGGGCKWYDHRDTRGGNGVQLAKKLGLTVPRERLTSAEKAADLRRRQAAAEARQQATAEAVDNAERWARASGAWIATLPPATADTEVVRYLKGRGLPPEAADFAGMVAPVDGPAPHDTAEPKFTKTRRLLAPVVDASGCIVGYRGRDTWGSSPAKERGPKGMSADHPHGRAYACPRLRQALQGESRARAELSAYGLAVVEGVPDMIAIAALLRLWEAAPLIMGVYGGGSQSAGKDTYSLGAAALFGVGSRIPADAPIVLLTHCDDVGHRYAVEIVTHAGGSPERAERLYRPPVASWPPHPEHEGKRCDVADVYRYHGPESVVELLLSATNRFTGRTFQRPEVADLNTGGEP